MIIDHTLKGGLIKTHTTFWRCGVLGSAKRWSGRESHKEILSGRNIDRSSHKEEKATRAHHTWWFQKCFNESKTHLRMKCLCICLYITMQHFIHWAWRYLNDTDGWSTRESFRRVVTSKKE